MHTDLTSNTLTVQSNHSKVANIPGEMFEHALFEDMRGHILGEGQQKVVQ